MNKVNLKLLWIAAGISLVCTMLFYQYLSTLEKQEEVKKYIEVVVAKQDLPANTKITKDLLETKKTLAASVQNSVKEEEAIGKYVKEIILANEPIRRERLVEDNVKQLFMKIPEDKRAVSVQVNEYIAVADLIIPGNFVDIYLNQEEKTVETAEGKVNYINMTKLVLQNIQVVAISKRAEIEEKEREKTPSAYSITLAVTPSDAEKLIYAENYGTIKLALRRVNDDNIVTTYGVNEVTMRNQ
ncbi:MAG TPA: Flp pilus assembly protein CpaB [Clostridiales bacterium]|nr:MAG: Flp pilus assembly protein CpaB [Clostridiales bacterium GWD2_32_59]HAN10746.1 Flp pilus assembly protein CpaB [Clostridiales bacterium]